MKKVLLITNIISPYRIPLFNYISQNGDFNFKVIALAEKEKNREWNLAKEKIKSDYEILPGWHVLFRRKKREIPVHLSRGVLKAIWRYNPDIVITSGYDCFAYWLGFLYCKFLKKKYILWNETSMLSVGSVKDFRGLLKKIIIKGADRYIAFGKKAEEYLEYFKADPKNIHLSLNTVDMKYFQDKVFECRSSQGFLKQRRRYPRVLFLYVGRMVKGKEIEQVLRALNIARDPEIGFMIVGSGPEEKNLRGFCQEARLENVFFEGFQQQEDLPKYYALSDVLILPSSQEVWGLVVNEALASGLYVLCSQCAGAAYDLITEGWNGEIFESHNIEVLAMLIKRAKEQIEDIRKRRWAISQHACRKFSIERSAQAFLEAIECENF